MQIRDTSESRAYNDLHHQLHHTSDDQLSDTLARLRRLPSGDDYRGVTVDDALEIASAEDDERRHRAAYL